GEELNIFTGAVLENEGESAGGTHAGNGRWREVKGNSLGNLAQLTVQTRFDDLELLFAALSVVPWLQRDPEEGVVAGTRKTQQAEANDAGGVFHSRSLGQDALNLACHFFSALG